MRLNIRLAGALAFMVAALACTSSSDSSTGASPGVSRARVALAPTFSRAAAAAYDALAANGANITNVHIVLTDLGGHVTLDTVVAFPVGNDTLSVVLPIDIQGREEDFTAQVDLRDANNVVQFSSTQKITARSASLPPIPQVPLVLQYVGPGATAKTVSVSPSDGTLLPSATITVFATAVDSNGLALPDLSTTWGSSDTTIVRVTKTGAAAAQATAVGPRGVVTVTAKSPTGVIGTAKITVVPQAATLAVIGGGGQTGAALDTLPTPFTVEVRATDGGVMAGVLVTFTSVTTAGSIATSSTSTDVLGRATTRMVLGRDAGSYTYQAAAGSLSPVTVSETATAATVGGPYQLIPLSGLPSGFSVGVTATQQFSGQLADSKGYYVHQAGVVLNATLQITTNTGATSTKTLSATSDAQGVITLSIPAFDAAGNVVITIVVPDIKLTMSGSFPIS